MILFTPWPELFPVAWTMAYIQSLTPGMGKIEALRLFSRKDTKKRPFSEKVSLCDQSFSIETEFGALHMVLCPPWLLLVTM